jgi:hypothetical protein
MGCAELGFLRSGRVSQYTLASADISALEGAVPGFEPVCSPFQHFAVRLSVRLRAVAVQAGGIFATGVVRADGIRVEETGWTVAGRCSSDQSTRR